MIYRLGTLCAKCALSLFPLTPTPLPEIGTLKLGTFFILFPPYPSYRKRDIPEKNRAPKHIYSNFKRDKNWSKNQPFHLNLLSRGHNNAYKM